MKTINLTLSSLIHRMQQRSDLSLLFAMSGLELRRSLEESQVVEVALVKNER